MSAVAAASVRGAGQHDWSRRYPPALVIFVAVLLAIVALPSALNLPQANPGQTLEYAPVPGNQGQAPPGGNLEALGLGESSAGPGAPSGQGPGILGGLPGQLPPGQGSIPSTKQCVGNPPRQTEDPLSPPCVAYFSGDNGGATYQGVTRTEIRVLVYWEGYQIASDCDSQPTPPGQYYDLDLPPQSGESCKVSATRILLKYFNNRYQTYGRHVHGWVYFSNDFQNGSVNSGPAWRRGEAADNYSKIHPFAVLPEVLGDEDAYEQALAQKGVVMFTEFPFLSATFFQQFGGLFWGFAPSLQKQADSLASYMCQKVVQPGKVTFAGSFPAGTPRKFGVLKTTDPLAVTLRKFQDTVISDMQARCSFSPADTQYYPVDSAQNYTSSSSASQNQSYQTYAQPEMSEFFQKGITTIIWPGGTEYKFSPAAANLNYYPEWVQGGDYGSSDGNLAASQQDQREWTHQVLATPQTHVPSNGVPPDCDEAWNTVHPGDPAITRAVDCGEGSYISLRQLFTGIQLSGPHLTPKTMDQGYHAIPPVRSTSADVPACYYDPGDYTCVKDATAEWWDPNAPNPTGTPGKGCFRMMENGARYLSGRWPPGDAIAQKAPDNICNFAIGNLQVLRID